MIPYWGISLRMEISEIRKSISLMKAVIISDRVHDQIWRAGARAAERPIDRTLALVAKMVLKAGCTPQAGREGGSA